MSPPTASFERAFYIGNALSGIIYGVQIYMVFHSCYLLLNTKDDGNRWRNARFYVVFSCVMLILTTFAMSANFLMGQLMWIEHRDFPGGPFAYYSDYLSTYWVNILGTTSCIVGNYLNDALLLYRCYIIWSGNLCVVIFPFILYLGTIAMSLMALTESALPNSNFFVKRTTNFAIPWLSLTSGLNAIVTILISGRILYYARRASVTGTANRQYTSIAAILIESALPFTILGVLSAICFGRQLAAELAFASVWGAFVAISPQLIILRVAMGRAWSKETPTRFAQHTTTAVQFAHIESGVGETEHTTTEVQFANLERGVGETEPTTTEVQFANVQKGGEETDSE